MHFDCFSDPILQYCMMFLCVNQLRMISNLLKLKLLLICFVLYYSLVFLFHDVESFFNIFEIAAFK